MNISVLVNGKKIYCVLFPKLLDNIFVLFPATRVATASEAVQLPSLNHTVLTQSLCCFVFFPSPLCPRPLSVVDVHSFVALNTIACSEINQFTH